MIDSEKAMCVKGARNNACGKQIYHFIFSSLKVKLGQTTKTRSMWRLESTRRWWDSLQTLSHWSFILACLEILSVEVGMFAGWEKCIVRCYRCIDAIYVLLITFSLMYICVQVYIYVCSCGRERVFVCESLHVWEEGMKERGRKRRWEEETISHFSF